MKLTKEIQGVSPTHLVLTNLSVAVDSQYSAFADQVLPLADEFEDEAIAHLIQPHMNGLEAL